ncbi:deoxyguanosinetriphosphate triphosphohydrolase family protein [Leucobacter sp. wl10]|uniref:deoxyguanosinetriphosphate triphosphohydrolase family protein n=1 Tax=Leucobacter sp. wl10 TaxID=2304677 RepID=UPI000E5BA231|nr:dNTP triphosphohydrolase [Leucobacter sp. wl10]RGE19863.1 dNTP triphosphohydrolase [Leucobacter sp. wl10]
MTAQPPRTRGEPAPANDDPREARRYVEHVSSQHRSAAVDDTEGRAPGAAGERSPQEYRIDLERIRFSPYFARLSDVTQVVPQSGVGPVMHNRLTHSLKVSAVARVIAAQLAGHEARHAAFARGERVEDDETGAIVTRLGGCDTIVAQAAAHAHDVGHPPFGHLGERVLDRVARERLGLAEGFEGNAQSFRILTQLDTLGRDFPGLNLTAASRAATLKYPWTRAEWIGVTVQQTPVQDRPRGVGGDPVEGAEKFSAYALEATEMERALAAFPRIGGGLQTVECAVMDLADDIAYAVHDLDDFARAGVLQQAAVSGELRAWLAHEAALAAEESSELQAAWRAPGRSLELLWRRVRAKDAWIADRDAFTAAVRRVSDEVAESLLATPYDGGIDSERAVSSFTRRWIEHLRTSIVVDEHPNVRGGHVRLDRQAWHEVAVLKFVHAHFVLERPELGQTQRGRARVVQELALGFDEWLGDPADSGRAPRRLLEWSDEATDASFALRRDRPELLIGDTSDAGLRQQGRARAILDYVASLSDQQAVSTHRELTGAA